MPIKPAVVEALLTIFGQDDVYLDAADCWIYGYDNSKLHHPPDAVAMASSHEQVVACVALCKEYQIPLTTRGRGTGTTGAAVPTSGGIVLSLERMNQVLEFDPGNRSIRVQAGITNLALQNFLKPHHFFWAPDPSSAEYCSVGGNLACNAAGPRAVKYGSCRDNTLRLKAVTGNAETIITGSKTSKGVVGLDLTRLLIGSEGCLAIITEADLKLLPLPSDKNTFRVLFSSHAEASTAIQALMAQAHTPCALEFMDHHALDLLRQHSPLELPQAAAAMLMVEIDGDPDSLAVSSRHIESTLAALSPLEINCAHSPEQAKELWQARKALSPILRNLAPNKINEDVVVPIPQLSNLLTSLDQLSERYNLPIVNFGHAGNGNLHVNILYDAADPIQDQNAKSCLPEIFSLVLSLDGTLSGEHGVGIAKRDYVDRELGETELRLMRQIKQQFDPDLILNPNKGWPTES